MRLQNFIVGTDLDVEPTVIVEKAVQYFSFQDLLNDGTPGGEERFENLGVMIGNAAAYEKLCQKACEVWKGKNHLEAFLPDHGCHAIDGDLGAHGLDMPEDMNIIHFYSLHKN